MKISTAFVAGVLGLSLAVSCDGSSSTGDRGTGGTGGNGGAGCEAMHYSSPGCNTSPTCDNGSGGACFGLACGCDGKVLTGCGLFSAPFAYTIPFSSVDASDPSALSCDPNADAGH